MRTIRGYLFDGDKSVTFRATLTPDEPEVNFRGVVEDTEFCCDGRPVEAAALARVLDVDCDTLLSIAEDRARELAADDRDYLSECAS